jgi:hypothetical protein
MLKHNTMIVCMKRRYILYNPSICVSAPDVSGEPQASTILSLRELSILSGYETGSAPEAFYIMVWRKIFVSTGNYTLAFG